MKKLAFLSVFLLLAVLLIGCTQKKPERETSTLAETRADTSSDSSESVIGSESRDPYSDTTQSTQSQTQTEINSLTEEPTASVGQTDSVDYGLPVEENHTIELGEGSELGGN